MFDPLLLWSRWPWSLGCSTGSGERRPVSQSPVRSTPSKPNRWMGYQTMFIGFPSLQSEPTPPTPTPLLCSHISNNSPRIFSSCKRPLLWNFLSLGMIHPLNYHISFPSNGEDCMLWSQTVRPCHLQCDSGQVIHFSKSLFIHFWLCWVFTACL